MQKISQLIRLHKARARESIRTRYDEDLNMLFRHKTTHNRNDLFDPRPEKDSRTRDRRQVAEIYPFYPVFVFIFSGK